MTQHTLVFDLGGVFVELSGVNTMRQWTQDRLPLDELWNTWYHSKYVRAFESGQMDRDTFASGIVSEFKLPVDGDEFLTEFSSWSTSLFPGSRRLLSDLKERYTLACLSNTNSIHWSYLCETFHLDDYFHYNFPSHEIGKIKPDIDTFQFVVEQLAAHPTDVYFFDDTEANVKSAQKAGINAHLVVGIDELNQTLLDLKLV